MEQLTSLLSKKSENLQEWVRGKIPDYRHYKRVSVSYEKALELARAGAAKVGAYFGDQLFFTQSLIAGAVLSGEFDNFVIVCCSQYGKSWLMGRLSLIRAFEGGKEYITAATGDGANIIMNHCLSALQHASPDMRKALTMKKDQLERLATSLSKGKISFKNGVVEALTLGDTYQDNIARNKAVGRGGDFFVDEAANVSDDTFAEMGRSEFSSVDGTNGIQVKISNPHRPGAFYEELTEDDPPEGTFILWMDILTAVEEERWTVKKVLASKFAKNRSTRRRYLLCVLDEEGDSMFPKPVSYDIAPQDEYKQYFLGVDASFRGKDKTSIALVSVDDNAYTRVEAVTDIDIQGKEWIEGVTSEVIADRIDKIAKAFHVGLICVDYGSGIWLVDALKDRHLNVKGIAFGERPTRSRVKDGHYMAARAVSVRDEMHLDMQNLMEERMIAFHRDVVPYIKNVLPYVTAEVKPNGQIKVIKKSEIKAAIGRSPDELDAILLGIHAAVLFGASYNEYIA